jgi:cytochrome bd ubiquinol oxidase subunit II
MATAVIALALGFMRGGIMARLVGTGWSRPLIIAATLAAFGAVMAVALRRYRVARVAAAGQVTLILWGWALAQFPLIIPPRLTIDEAAAPAATLGETLAVLAGGAVILVPSLWYLLRVFKTRRDPGIADASRAGEHP